MNHPAASRHPSAEGNLDRGGAGGSSPIRRKGELKPPRRQAATPPQGGQVAAGTHQVPSVGGVFVLLGGN